MVKAPPYLLPKGNGGNEHARFAEGRLETCPISGNAPTAYSTPELLFLSSRGKAEALEVWEAPPRTPVLKHRESSVTNDLVHQAYLDGG